MGYRKIIAKKLLHLCQHSECAKHHEPGVEGSEGVSDADEDGVPVAVAVEAVVGGEEDVRAVGHPEGVEYLRARVRPDVVIRVDSLPVRVQVVICDSCSKPILK